MAHWPDLDLYSVNGIGTSNPETSILFEFNFKFINENCKKEIKPFAQFKKKWKVTCVFTDWFKKKVHTPSLQLAYIYFDFPFLDYTLMP